MAEYRITIDIAAPPERVFGMWTDLERMTEWVGGVTRVTDVTGPVDVAGTRYTVRFGPMRSPTEILEVEPPPGRARSGRAGERRSQGGVTRFGVAMAATTSGQARAAEHGVNAHRRRGE